MLDRKHQKYDWPELRGLVPSNASPQPRLAQSNVVTTTTYGTKHTGHVQTVSSNGLGANPATQSALQPNQPLAPAAVQQLPKKPMNAWKHQKTLAPTRPPSAQVSAAAHCLSPCDKDTTVENLVVGNATNTALLLQRGPVMVNATATNNANVVRRGKNLGAPVKRLMQHEPLVGPGDPTVGAGEASKQWEFRMPVHSTATSNINSVLQPLEILTAPTHSLLDEPEGLPLLATPKTELPPLVLGNGSAINLVSGKLPMNHKGGVSGGVTTRAPAKDVRGSNLLGGAPALASEVIANGVGLISQVTGLGRFPPSAVQPLGNPANNMPSTSGNAPKGPSKRLSSKVSAPVLKRVGFAPATFLGSMDADDQTTSVSQLQIEGNSLSDVPSAASALLALESCVARERRAKEELLNAHKQVLNAFRQVVRTFLMSLDDAPPRKTATAMSIAKCSVVVHTLVTTIQSYLRSKISQRLTVLYHAGVQTSLAARLHLANKLPAVLCVNDLAVRGEYTPITTSTARTESLSGGDDDTPTSRSSVHDRLLDNATIARLKQLYFDYYDCETFVLPGQKRNSIVEDDDVQELPMEERDLRHVIEEKNVLEEVVEDCVPAEDEDMMMRSHHSDEANNIEESSDFHHFIPEEIDDDAEAHGTVGNGLRVEGVAMHVHASSTNVLRGESVGSIMFNESAAMREIFGSPRTASDVLSYSSDEDEALYHDRCEVEDL